MRVPDRVHGWMTSDLVAIPVTLAAVVIFGVSFALFVIAGPIAGFAFAILGLILIYLLIAQPGRRDERRDAVTARRFRNTRESASGDGPRRYLVIANHGLDRHDVPDRLRRLGARRPAQVRIVAPVAPASVLKTISDDVDSEYLEATARLDTILAALRDEGIDATGRVAVETDPRTALAEALTDFAPDELLLVGGAEHGWAEAARLADELRTEAGLPVTKLNGSRTPQPG